MATQTNMIIIGAIGLTIVVALIFAFRNFDLKKISEDVSKGVDNFITDAGKGLEQFSRDAGENISSFSENITEGVESLINPEKSKETQQTRNTLDIFNRQVEEKKIEAKSFGFSDVEEFERATDTNRDPLKFNPDGIIGFGFPQLNEGRGIPDTPENRSIIDDLINGRASFEPKTNTATFKDVELFNFPQLPEAFAAEIPERQTVIQAPSTDRPLSLSEFASKSKTKAKVSLTPRTEIKKIVSPSLKNPKIIQGTVVSEIQTGQEFKVRNADSSRSIKGVIRETPKSPTRLRTDSKKQPLETASQRANRIFVEQGRFVGEGKGFGVTKASERSFSFGTNTGSALKKATTGTNSKTRLADRKKIEEQKALKVFDSGSISNF